MCNAWAWAEMLEISWNRTHASICWSPISELSSYMNKKYIYFTYIPVLFRKILCLLLFLYFFSLLIPLAIHTTGIVLLEVMLTAHSYTIICFVICFIWPFYVNNTARNNRWNIAWDFKLFLNFFHFYARFERAGGHKETSSILADQYMSPNGGGGGGSGSEPISTAVHMEPKLNLDI